MTLPQYMTPVKCYACDEPAVGLRDRRPEGGRLEIGCLRHADPYLPQLLTAKRITEEAAKRKRARKRKPKAGKRKRAYGSR